MAEQSGSLTEMMSRYKVSGASASPVQPGKPAAPAPAVERRNGERRGKGRPWADRSAAPAAAPAPTRAVQAPAAAGGAQSSEWLEF
jgi:hypothetical protein